jgi:hypothetical protein
MTSFHSHLLPGVPLALASAVVFGASAPLAKLLLGTVDAQLLAGVFYLGAGIGLADVHGGRAAVGLPAREAPLRLLDLPWLAAVILFGGLRRAAAAHAGAGSHLSGDRLPAAQS